MNKVLINKPIHKRAIERLSQEVEVLTPFDQSTEQVIEMLVDVQALILCAGLKVTDDVLGVMKAVKVIGRHGAGMDILDLEAATRRSIPVVFTPEGPTESTAEHAFTLMMAAARKLTFLDRETRSGNFHVRDRIVGRELSGAKVGVVGFGHIGQRFAAMCRDALSMQVYGFDPFVDRTKVESWGAIYMEDLVQMAFEVDVLSLHCPHTPETHHLVDQRVLAALGPDGYLINASRGPVTDEAALVAALQDGRLGGAGLDVFDPEPPAADNPLFQLDNVVLTPHLASFTEEGRQRMGMMVAEDVLRVLRGEKPVFPANSDVINKILDKE
jgi:D-3-phosphoglycerate dehydrogenase / 2-oxoglutarate reductase